METEWVDFRIIKAAITMQMVLDRYDITLKKSGHELRGKCPIHHGSSNKHFAVNVSKNVFKCFFAQCDAHGNVLDFVAAMEQCSVRDAAVKLRDWFRVGDTTEQSKQARQEEIEIKKGIYTDNKGTVYEVIGIATHAERSECFVVYRELFGNYRFLVTPVESFQTMFEPSKANLTLINNL